NRALEQSPPPKDPPSATIRLSCSLAGKRLTTVTCFKPGSARCMTRTIARSSTLEPLAARCGAADQQNNRMKFVVSATTTRPRFRSAPDYRQLHNGRATDELGRPVRGKHSALLYSYRHANSSPLR